MALSKKRASGNSKRWSSQRKITIKKRDRKAKLKKAITERMFNEGYTLGLAQGFEDAYYERYMLEDNSDTNLLHNEAFRNFHMVYPQEYFLYRKD